VRDDVRRVAHRLHALLPWQAPPLGKSGLGGGDRVPRVLPGGPGEVADHHIPVDGRALLVVALALSGLPVHVEGMLLAEPRPGCLDALLVRLVELWIVRRHRGVRDPNLCLRHRSHLRRKGYPRPEAKLRAGNCTHPSLRRRRPTSSGVERKGFGYAQPCVGGPSTSPLLAADPPRQAAVLGTPFELRPDGGAAVLRAGPTVA